MINPELHGHLKCLIMRDLFLLSCGFMITVDVIDVILVIMMAVFMLMLLVSIQWFRL